MTLVCTLDHMVNWYLDFSPIEILARRIFRNVQNDVFLPNADGKHVVIGHLANGDTMLFLQGLQDTHSSRLPTPVATYLVELADLLRPHGFDLVVVLVPSKYTVYAPLLMPPDLATNDEEYLGPLTSMLRASGVPVINLTQAFQRDAASDQANRQYLYFLDDTHWNSRGIGIAANEISKVWPPS